MPAPSIIITSEFSGSVVAKGATDDLSAQLLKHAGFQQIDDWHGRRHRLPTTMPVIDKVAIASHAAENGADLQRAVDHLLHPEHGALERVREALEVAGEHINDLDDEAYALADRFGFAAEFVSSAQSELVDSEAELRRVGNAPSAEARARSSMPPDHRGAALATSPAVAKANLSPSPGVETTTAGTTVRPSHAPGPRR
ncbi:hypothetical protein [Streptomyces sp. WAC08241]|uniref:hypothetical protein n=1 Tax=Streptomyces sp. WAC08241 TaxID=2487421 RepID=UPI000F794F9B|nr:hypothetical protein [Streptomyces sp. WAC08241]RSS41861.1 hypothetical protein EF906_13520 [Streptomyces sp. WAC08241]